MWCTPIQKSLCRNQGPGLWNFNCVGSWYAASEEAPEVRRILHSSFQDQFFFLIRHSIFSLEGFHWHCMFPTQRTLHTLSFYIYIYTQYVDMYIYIYIYNVPVYRNITQKTEVTCVHVCTRYFCFLLAQEAQDHLLKPSCCAQKCKCFVQSTILAQTFLLCPKNLYR